MSDWGSEGPMPTPVTIYGRTYHLKGEGEAGYLEELAAEVDRRMKEVGETTGTADTLKVAILAALNITDEWFRSSRRRDPVAKTEPEERLARLTALLDEVLVE